MLLDEVLRGTTSKGEIGELLARILLCYTLATAVPPSCSTVICYYNVVPLSDFLKVLVSREQFETQKEYDAWVTQVSTAKGWVNFNHFLPVRTAKGNIYYTFQMFQEAFLRGAAFICPVGCTAIDIIIPVYLDDPDQAMGCIGVQVKNKK